MLRVSFPETGKTSATLELTLKKVSGLFNPGTIPTDWSDLARNRAYVLVASSEYRLNILATPLSGWSHRACIFGVTPVSIRFKNGSHGIWDIGKAVLEVLCSGVPGSASRCAFCGGTRCGPGERT